MRSQVIWVRPFMWAVIAAIVVALLAVPSRALIIRVVPADDPVLAAMLLIGEGQLNPVLLFDPRNQFVISRFATDDQRSMRCLYQPHTPLATRELMEAATGSPCTVVDNLPALARALWPKAREVIVARGDDYDWLLRAAAFAGATGSALLPMVSDEPLDPMVFNNWPVERLYLTPNTSAVIPRAVADRLTAVEIDTPRRLVTELLKQPDNGSPGAVVVTNPRDRLGIFSPSSLSLLAPLVSAMHRAPLLLVTTRDPEMVERQVKEFIAEHQLQATHIILVGDELALRSHRVPDPVSAAGGPEAVGGGREVRVELFSEIQRQQPQDFAVGRIVAEDAAQASALLAAQLHESTGGEARPVIVLSNADGVFSLGETISRATVSDMRNVGIPVRAYFRDEVTPSVIEDALKKTDLLVWEGHARDLTLEEQGGIFADKAPTFVVLQGCYTLDRSDPFILMERGTRGIVATSAAIYSASGSAFARALFDALVYENADLGTAVRNARNYLLALSELKRRRGHREWHKTYRAALAFALWGDPTSRLPLRTKRPKVPPAQWQRNETDLILTVPDRRLATISVDRYRVRPVPRAMLGGLLLGGKEQQERRLTQLFFTVQDSPANLTAVCAPTSAWNVVSMYAPYTRTLTVLARPEWGSIPDSSAHGRFLFPLVTDLQRCPAGIRQAASAP